MQRIAFPALVESLGSSPAPLNSSGVSVYLVDNEIILRLLVQKSQKSFGCLPSRTGDLKKLSDLVDDLATEPLFGAVAPAIFELPAKLTKTQWKDCQGPLNRYLHAAKSVSLPPLWLVGSAALRKTVGECDFNSHSGSVFLAYPPQKSEVNRTVSALMCRHEGLRSLSQSARAEVASQALLIYESDFVLMDNHFKRMDETGLDFREIFVDVPVMGVFQLIESLTSEKLPSVLLRLMQCQKNGEEPARILSTLHHFLRQFVRFSCSVKSGIPESQVFQSLGIPYPAQAKFSSALRRLDLQRIIGFLGRCPDLEVRLRQSSRNYDLLALEFVELLH